MAAITLERLAEELHKLAEEGIVSMTLSKQAKDEKTLSKVSVRPVLIQGATRYQISETVGQKVLHTNVEAAQLPERLLAYLPHRLQQLQAETTKSTVTVLGNAKGTLTYMKKTKAESAQRAVAPASHNKAKNYIIAPEEKVPFLVDLGVQSKDGKLINARYDKFRQINRFLEYVRDIVKDLKPEGELTIIDFGCGKSYLTFAIYYYLHEKLGRELNMIGLDLKEDVIDHCNRLAENYGYDGLHFLKGDIGSYEGVDHVDMVVTLHACDIATDHALYKAVIWDADVILSVPCCQHELNAQMCCETLQPILKYGILKERFSAIATDAIRANLLEKHGYSTQILEFIDMEHTPKNLMIRAVKRGKTMRPNAATKRDDLLTEFLGVSQTLEKLLETE